MGPESPTQGTHLLGGQPPHGVVASESSRAACHTRVSRLAGVTGRKVSALQHSPGPARQRGQPSQGCEPELISGCELLRAPGQGDDQAPAVTAGAWEHMVFGKAHPWASGFVMRHR